MLTYNGDEKLTAIRIRQNFLITRICQCVKQGFTGLYGVASPTYQLTVIQPQIQLQHTAPSHPRLPPSRVTDLFPSACTGINFALPGTLRGLKEAPKTDTKVYIVLLNCSY